MDEREVTCSKCENSTTIIREWHVINRDTRKPYIVELSKEYAEQFKDYLKMLYIIFEPSEAGDLINFKCWLNKNEFKMVNMFLKEIAEKDNA